MVLVSRLARPHAPVVVAVALGSLAALAARPAPRAAAPLAVAACLVAILGGRPVRARFERGSVSVRFAAPFAPRAERRLGEFTGARVETVGEARRHRAERLAERYRARSGAEMPAWLHPPDAPGSNDHLRRLVLVPRRGDPLAVTAWLAEDDLGPAREEIEGLLR